MNKETNPFRVAIPYLWSGLGNYGADPSKWVTICHSLRQATYQHSIDFHTARSMVVTRLRDRTNWYAFADDWLQNWLKDNGHEPATRAQVQEWRRNWMLHLADLWDQGVRT